MKLLEVTKNNYDGLRTLSAAAADFCFYDPATLQVRFVYDYVFSARANFTGNEFDSVDITGSKTVGNVDDGYLAIALATLT